MNLQEINETINRIVSEWEYFKSINDRKEKEIEQKGSADPLTLEHIKKINDSIDEHKTSLERIETALARPRFNTAPMYNLSSSELKYQKALIVILKKAQKVKYLHLKLKASMTLVMRDIALPIKCLHKCQISWNLSLQCLKYAMLWRYLLIHLN